jgi:hypothetical protein
VATTRTQATLEGVVCPGLGVLVVNKMRGGKERKRPVKFDGTASPKKREIKMRFETH